MCFCTNSIPDIATDGAFFDKIDRSARISGACRLAPRAAGQLSDTAGSGRPMLQTGARTADHPEDMDIFLALSMSQAAIAHRSLAEVLALPPAARFARLILRLAEPDGTVRATQEELGRMAGMSRAAFHRSCATLISSGAVQMQYAGLRIIDYMMQRRAAESG